MKIIVDTREKERAIYWILKDFDKNGIEYKKEKLNAGDYMNVDNPKLLIDRKQNIREMATNCTKDRDRVEREMQRAKDAGARMVFLITQDKIDGKPITCLEDVMLWVPQKGQGTVKGETIYRRMTAWLVKYPISFQFCSRRDAGKKIIEILGGQDE